MKLHTTLATLAFAIGAASAGATTVDLASNVDGESNGTIYVRTTENSGTGVFEPFLRVQEKGTEQGYNGDFSGGGLPWDTKGGTWTHPLQFSDLIYREIDGIGYYEFYLDFYENQSGADRYLSLDSVKIWATDDPLTSDDEYFENLGLLGDPLYDMDVGDDGDTDVTMDADLSPGNGYADMLMYVLASNFAGVEDDDYITFYTSFGTPFASESSFEEWGVRVCETENGCNPPPPQVPVPGTLGLLGVGLLGLGVARRRAKT